MKQLTSTGLHHLAKGFTMVELLLIMGVAAIIFALSTTTFSNARTSTVLDTTVSVLAADIKNQQIKAMTGDTEGRGTPDTYGMYLSGNSYVLFPGSSYSAGNSNNATIAVDTSVQLSTTFPSNQIIFASSSGDILNYASTSATITVLEAQSGRKKVLRLNALGTITSVGDN